MADRKVRSFVHLLRDYELAKTEEEKKEVLLSNGYTIFVNIKNTLNWIRMCVDQDEFVPRVIAACYMEDCDMGFCSLIIRKYMCKMPDVQHLPGKYDGAFIELPGYTPEEFIDKIKNYKIRGLGKKAYQICCKAAELKPQA